MSDANRRNRTFLHKGLLLGCCLISLSCGKQACAESGSIAQLESLAAMQAGGSGPPVPARYAQNNSVVPLPSRASPSRTVLPRDITVVVPLSERGGYLGDLAIVIRNDQPEFDLNEVARLLERVAAPSTIDRLKARGAQGKGGIADLVALGVAAVWDPAALSIDVVVSAADKEKRTIEVADRERVEAAGFAKPALISIATNFRTSLDYVSKGFQTGLLDPFVDATMFGRILGVGFENEMSYDTGGFGLRRNGSRLVWDFEKQAVRAYVGDIRPPVRSFQASQEAIGLSIFSARQVIQPYRNFQPRGNQSFTLNEASNVDVVINGRPVRRLRLDSGRYELTDFPFLDGQNRVQFIVEDRTGRRELGSFDVFYDRSLLEPGLSEWALSLGTTSERGLRQPIYDAGRFVGTGYWRQGFSNTFTAGANLAMLEKRGLIGGEVLWASKYGVISADVGYSWGAGDTGGAATLTFQRNVGSGPGEDRIQWGLSAQARTEFFNPASDFAVRNNQVGEVSVFWSRSFGDRYSLNLGATQSWGLRDNPDRFSARVGVGAALTTSVGINADLTWENGRNEDQIAFRIQLTTRFGRETTVSSSYETRDNRIAITTQRSGQAALGNWSVNADLQKSDSSSALNAGAFLAGGRGEVGLALQTAMSNDLSEITDQRTSLRLAGAIGFADGAIAFGRPVFGAFAIVRPHKSLANKTVLIDYTSRGASGYATSRIFGPPLVGDIPTYSRRELKVDIDDLPDGYDLGTGRIAVRAAYGAGYNLRVGSADNLTVVGRALNEDGEPIAFIAGAAQRADQTNAPILELFTNGRGIFSASGLGPGQWTITLNTTPDPTILTFFLPEQGTPLRRLGDLKGVVR